MTALTIAAAASSTDAVSIEAVDHFCEMVCWIWFAPVLPSPTSSPFTAPTISGFSSWNTTPSSSSLAHRDASSMSVEAAGSRGIRTGMTPSPQCYKAQHSIPQTNPYGYLSPSPSDISIALEQHLQAMGQDPFMASLRPRRPASYEANRLEPTDRFRTFVHDAIASTQISPAAMAVSLLYIWRLKQMYPHLRGKDGSEYRIAVTSLMLSNKLLEDNTFTNKSWSEISHIDLRDITKMEVEFWLGLRMSIHVSVEDFASWQSKLRTFSQKRLKTIRAREHESSMQQRLALEQQQAYLMSTLPTPALVTSQGGSCEVGNGSPSPTQGAQQPRTFNHAPSARSSVSSGVAPVTPFTFSVRPDWSLSAESSSTAAYAPPPHCSSAVSSEYASPETRLLPLPALESPRSRRRPSSSASQDSVASIKRAFHNMHTVETAQDEWHSHEEFAPPLKRMAITQARDERYSPPQYALRTSVSPTVPRLRRPRQTSANGLLSYPRSAPGPLVRHAHSRSLGAVPYLIPTYYDGQLEQPNFGQNEHTPMGLPQTLAASFAGYCDSSTVHQLTYHQLAAGYERGVPYLMPPQSQYLYADVPLFPPSSRRPSGVVHAAPSNDWRRLHGYDSHADTGVREPQSHQPAHGPHYADAGHESMAMVIPHQSGYYAPSPLSKDIHSMSQDQRAPSEAHTYQYKTDLMQEPWQYRSAQTTFLGREQNA